MRLSVPSVLLAVTLAVSGATVEKRQAATSIDTLFKRHGKVFFGTAADQNRLSGTPSRHLVASSTLLALTSSSTWAIPSSSHYPCLLLVSQWAVTNGKKIRGHTFVWAQQLPSWVTAINDAPTLTAVLQNHITQVMTHYKGKLYAVDVVNEHIVSVFFMTAMRFALKSLKNEDGTIKSTHWTQVLGNNVFTIAFQAARAVDPNVKLYINDYNLDSNNAKVQGIVKLVKSINANGKLVDGIGTQAHLSAGGAGGMQAALVALAGAGVDVAITELDIAGASTNDYNTVVNACLAVPQCVSITVWGVRDPDSWRPTTNCLLFDANWQPKAAYNSIASILNTGGTTPPPTSTTSTPISTSTAPPTTTVSTHPPARRPAVRLSIGVNVVE
ncbi:Beta-xylanase [Mycena venus]|uniref:Beta-xylanase n=1 Tax=Mycena venus TaxID=2733690 RepID=A0A8H6X725_9AGAR|nr:Beta-xylanase [Mycena venus]